MSISIVFDNPKLEYYPAQAISGYVHVETKEAKNIKKIAIKFKGVLKTHWSERKTRHRNKKTEHYTVHYSGEQKLFDNGIILVEGPGKFKLEPGKYSYRFEFQLPSNLPVNWQGHYGSVKYVVKAFVDVPWTFDISCKHEFKIIPVVDLNFIARARERFLIEKQKTVGVLCCSSGHITVTATAPRSGFICSDVIPFDVHIENNSGAEIYETVIKIKKNVIYLSRHPTVSSRTESETLVSGVWETDVGPREQRVLRAPIALKLTEPSTVDETLIVKIAYLAEITCKIHGMHVNISETLPIVIGNVPMNGIGNDEERPMMMKPGVHNSSASAPSAPAEIGWNKELLK